MNQQKYIWIFPSNLHRWLWKDLARSLEKSLHMKTLFIIGDKQDLHFWEKQFDEPLEAEVAVHFDYLGYALDCSKKNVSENDVFQRAAAYEKKYGITLMRDMVLGCRHIGRTFILGGQGHPASRVSKTISKLSAVKTCMAITDDFEELAGKYPPGLMLVGGGGGGVYMKSACIIARRDRIPFRSLVHARFSDYYLWADSEFEESLAFKNFHEKQPEPSASDINYVQRHVAPSGLSVVGFAQMRNEIAWPAIIRRIVINYLRIFYGKIRGYRKSRVGPSPTDTAKMMIRQRLDQEKLKKLATFKITDLPPTEKVVYFPFQTEPEHSLNVLSPEHSNQLATAVELALSLPADSILAVKEHPYQIGRRTTGTYETLAGLPNVAFMNTDEPSIEIIKRANLVAVITSSAGYEAAVLGKPVIHFGQHGQALCLPHVQSMTGFCNLDKISELLSSDSDTLQKERQRDGARYYLALEKFCIDMSSYKVHGRTKRPNAEELSEIKEGLLKTLPSDFHQSDSREKSQ